MRYAPQATVRLSEMRIHISGGGPSDLQIDVTTTLCCHVAVNSQGRKSFLTPTQALPQGTPALHEGGDRIAAGPENLVDLGALLAAKRGDPVKVEGVSDPNNPDTAVYESGSVLAGQDAIIAGPTFADWLERLETCLHETGCHGRANGCCNSAWV